MPHVIPINELATYPYLSTRIDHITVTETHPDTDTTTEVTLTPPFVLRRQQHRGGTITWTLTPHGIHERVHVADQAPVTLYLKDPDPTPTQPPTPTTWNPQTPTPYPTPPHAAQQPTPPSPRRPAPWAATPPQS